MALGFPAAARPRALLIDLDGTLVDSAPDLRLSLNRQLEPLGLGPLTLEQVKGMVGDGVRVLLTRALAACGAASDAAAVDALLPGLMADYTAAPVVRTRPYPGVAETLAQLHRAGVALAVCTNKPLVPALRILEALELRRLFSAVIGGDSTPYRKPSPQPLQAALAALGCAPAEALMIGDGPHDAEGALAAGTGFVGVRYGYGSDWFTRHGTGLMLIDRFDELAALAE